MRESEYDALVKMLEYWTKTKKTKILVYLVTETLPVSSRLVSRKASI